MTIVDPLPVAERVIRLIRTETGRLANRHMTMLGDLDLDSLSYVELIMTIEDHFGVHLRDGRMFRTVGALIDAVERELAG